MKTKVTAMEQIMYYLQLLELSENEICSLLALFLEEEAQNYIDAISAVEGDKKVLN